MRVLVVGSGGREHTLVWKISQSKLIDKIFCAPGNAGISKLAECIDIEPNNIQELLNFAKKEKIDLTVVGPEAPLASGIVDEFSNYKLKIFGPNKLASRLESSKIFAKEIMFKYNIPTADFKIFDNPESAKKYITNTKFPCVIKADGLAAGKGVVVAKNFNEAIDAIKMIMEDKIFGKSGDRIIIEEYLEGEEASIIVITDSKNIIPLATSQDHKRVFDNDEGENTGGMGAYSPNFFITKELFNKILKEIIYPIVDALTREGIEYKGVLYAGIMLTKAGPKVLEFNVRFGDPETQAILPRLTDDLLEVMLATSYGCLLKIKKLNWLNKVSVCVVCASGGYPKSYQKGKEIFGLDEVEKLKDIVVFHAGTKKIDNKFITDGGRVLNIVGLADTINLAIDKTYEAVKKIYFEGIHYRKDIGKKALKILNA